MEFETFRAVSVVTHVTHMQLYNDNMEKLGHYSVWQLWAASSCHLFYSINLAHSADCLCKHTVQ
jgi:hypothetical protein